MKTIITALYLSTISVSAFAVTESDHRGFDIEPPATEEKREVEKVKWEGYVTAGAGHTKGHNHNLKFVRKSDGESFDIVDSPALEKIHCETSKNLWVNIEAEKTSQFLFWGNNLIVRNFEVVKELAQLPHKEKSQRRTFSSRRDREI